MVNLNHINKSLKDYFGYSPDGRANFRVVWSEDETEVRLGTFNEFYGSIFVRQYTGAKQVKKYNYIKERYILEKLMYGNNPELLHNQHSSYEPLFVFQDNKGNYLPPVWRAIEIIITTLLYGKKTSRITAFDEEEGLRQEEENDMKYLEEYMENKTPYLASKMKYGEAVSFGGIKKEMLDEPDDV